MQPLNSLLPALLALFLSSACCPAQLLSVDINGTVRSDVTAPGFTPWYVAGDLSGAKTTTISRSFTNFTYTYDADTGLPVDTNISLIIPCTITMTVPATADTTHYLNANYANKNGNSTSSDPNSGYRLSEDGVWAHWKDDSISVDQPYTNGGALSLSIGNLPAGVHTITTYHNDLWATNTKWHTNFTISRCVVSVNGVPAATNTPTFISTNDSKCGFTFCYVTNSYDGQPVLLNFDPDHSSILDFVILNGFEIDRPSPPGTTASAVFPLPNDEHAAANNDVPLPGTVNAGHLNLQWQPAGFAISNYLYFGTNPVTVANATPASTEYKGAAAATPGATNSFTVTNLNSALTYYWRVDQLDVLNGATNLVTGTVWKFRTRHLAFPTAEGYGRFARGGRGGVVYEVTNLNDSGPGSYRAAIEASGPRTVVFRVSGLIQLQGPCVIGNGYLTVAGQTAPGEGICLANWRAGMSSCNDVIMRFMRCRLGDGCRKAMDGIGLGNSTHSIIDHTSISWTMDEGTSSRQSGAVGSQTSMITFQHNLISEPLRYSYHYAGQSATSTTYEPHAFAGSISGEIGSYHHNLIAHSTDRNWSLAGGLDQSSHYAGSLDIRNCVVYNWRGRTTDGGVARLNYVNNYYKPAPVNLSISCSWLLRLDTINTNWGTEYIFMTNNVWEGKTYYSNNWMTGSFANGLPLTNLVITNSELYPSYVDTQSASNAYKLVLSDAGCNMQLQDLIDRRVIGEALDGTTHYIGTNGNPYIVNGVTQATSGADNPGFIDSQTDVRDYTNDVSAANYSPNAPWGPYRTYNVPLDTDHDGLPDWWERLKGLKTNSPAGDYSDANADLLGDGYTELERFLNWLALPHYDCTNGTPLNVELTQYTRGFTNRSPSYTVFNPSNGAVSLSSRTAIFTPTVATNALGSFLYRVTDSTGFSYTNTINVHILASGQIDNTAPSLSAVPGKTVNVGASVLLTNQATDLDVPPQSLSFKLLAAPTNAVINPTNGVLTWRPLVTQANTTNAFTVVVTDNGSPALSTTQSYHLIVNPVTRPSASLTNTAGRLTLSVAGQTGPDYGIQSSTNLTDWQTLLITNPAAMPFNWVATNNPSVPVRFYRIKVGPPLP
jgi:hypothetical protein